MYIFAVLTGRTGQIERHVGSIDVSKLQLRKQASIYLVDPLVCPTSIRRYAAANHLKRKSNGPVRHPRTKRDK